MKKNLNLHKLAVIPRINGRLKDHKISMPFCPIVSECFEINYFLEKAYVPFLKQLLPESRLLS